VLYLQPAAHFGGAERQAATIVPVLRDLGVETTPMVGPGDEILAWLAERGVGDAVFSRNFPGGWPKLAGPRRAVLPWRYVRCMTELMREIEEVVVARKIDVIYAAMAIAWIAATPVARRLGIPIVWRAGGTECSPAERRWLSIFTRFYRPDHLVCNGEAVRSMYAPMVRAPATVIRNGIDARQFRPGLGDRAKLRVPGARVVIGFAGRMVPQKRPEDFIEVAARLAPVSDVAFLLAGDGSRRAYYAEYARAAGAHTLSVIGYVHDMRDFYAACDVLVLPSRAEGCPNVVLEAMAMGTTVIAADTPATREIVTHGADGMLYPVGDREALQSAIAELLVYPEQRELIVARAYRRVAALTARECAVRTAALLHDVAASRRPRSSQAPAPHMVLQA